MSFVLPLWIPWLGGLVLGSAALLTVGMAIVQLRLLPLGLRQSLLVRRTDGSRALPLLFAASAGLGSLVAGVLAVELGGPGALIWLWIATLFGMALSFGDSARRPEPAGAVARGLGMLSSVGLVATAIALGGALQTQQVGALLADTDAPWIALGVAAVAVPLVFLPRLRTRVLGLLAGLGWLAATVGAGAIALRDPNALGLLFGDAVNQAFGIEAAAVGLGSGSAVALMGHGVLRATMASLAGTGFGAAADLQSPGRPAAAMAMLVPLVAALTATASGAARMQVDAKIAPVAAAKLVPLEQTHSQGLRPSQDVGQTIVLPPDTAMQAGKAYRMLLRADPRGHRTAKLFPEDNAVALPAWAIAEKIDTVVFRGGARKEFDRSGWDLRIPVTREVLEQGQRALVKLTPVDPAINFDKLIKYYELDPTPFVVFGDAEFTGQVAQAVHPSLGKHLAMFEAETADRPNNPKLHEFFRLSYRGPYAASDEPLVWGFVAEAGLDREPGDIVELELRADPRGEDLVRVNRAGGVEAPAWTFLMDVDTLVVRHDDDPSRDVFVQVTARFDGHRIRFDPVDPTWKDFRRVAKMDGMSGPFVRVADQRFLAEVRSGARLATDLRERRVLVPLHPSVEPQGSTELPYAPHPGELTQMGMRGPFLVDDGVRSLLAPGVLDDDSGRGVGLLLQIGGLLLGLTAIAAWAEIGARALGQLLGPRAAVVGRIAVIAGAAAGAVIPWVALVAWIDAALALAVVPNLALLVMSLASLRTAAGDGPPSAKAMTSSTSSEAAGTSPRRS